MTYLNTAGFGLVSEAATNAGNELYKKFGTVGSAATEEWRDVEANVIKKKVADFIGANENNVAFVPNFSFAMNSIVQSLKGDEKILLYKNDYPSVNIPFIINGFDITWIDDEHNFSINLDKIELLIKEKQIDIVALSHVQWQSGYKLDLERLSAFCKEQDVWLIVDGTQSLGAIEINLSALPIDVFIASNYKWMNAGFGTGILFSNDEFLQTYPPKISGNNSKTVRVENGKYLYEPSILNFEPGHLNQFGFTVLNKAIEEKNTIGIQNIEAHNKSLTQKLLNEIINLPVHLIGDANEENRTSIVVIKEKNGLHDFLLKRNIITTARNGNIRISMHFHNTREDVDAIVDAMKDWTKI
ncbi:aminotransferase class V-fold PLP-dependent enzyme [Arachidicoccus ginsenosidimutans]|uniref:aminotransferase class V-fold PLP-dependent enzyme n=1 Tax=Arachidicoccus sp. BS20 TaxID=1850526 RepID=UPI001E2CA611|nr:aminotransferase class V-fold PLP-dependent enzyme [Arachidicoccus sp. BS20]